MRYKNEDDNRYRVNFMIATEKLMDKLTVREFISYLEEKAEFEDTTHEYIDGKVVECKAYDLKEENSNLRKEFLVTSDGRVFYWRTLMDKIELIDEEESEPAPEQRARNLIGNNNHNDRSEHAYTERMVHGRAGEKISGSVRQMVRQ